MTLDTVTTHVPHDPGQARAEGACEPAIIRHAPPKENMSTLRPLLERNRIFAVTAAHAGLATKQLSGHRIVQPGEGRCVSLRPEVLS